MAYQVKSTTKQRATWRPDQRALYNKVHDIQGMCDAFLRRVEEQGWVNEDRPNILSEVLKRLVGDALDLDHLIDRHIVIRDRVAAIKATHDDADDLPPMDQQEYRVVGIAEDGQRTILYEGSVNMYANVADFRARESGAWVGVAMEKRLSPQHPWFLLHRKSRKGGEAHAKGR